MVKKIHRVKEEAVVAGVVAGLARYFDQDPVLFRVAAITMLILTGVFPGIIVYLVAWFMIPHRPRHADYTID
ncbi:MAG: PspC domain-containing protein [Candidatus Pacebacteria bacterium]|jgi:phage shock protein PspC (stress-responsive transcriptional regulator)|nr:PspC domain-containing protein [Candidatus Paceibacterota bacterium]